jgi:hypothetical protein
MGMSSYPTDSGSMLNSGLTQQGPGNPSIGMPYGPGYTDPNQPKGPGDISIGMPAGPGYMEPSSGGKGGMPQTQTPGFEPQFNFGTPNQISQLVLPPPGINYGTPNQISQLVLPPPGINYGTPGPGPGDIGIGMPAGPGYMQPPAYMQPKQAFNPNPNPVSNMGAGQMPAAQPIPQTTQQIADQVGLRTNFVPSRLRPTPNIITTAMQQQRLPQFDRARENVPVLGTRTGARPTPIPMSQSTRPPAAPAPRLAVAKTGSLRRR